MISVAVAIGLQALSGKTVLKDVAARLGKLNAISVTLKTYYTNNRKTVIEHFQVLKGGYLRYEQSGQLMIVNPKVSWIVVPAKKTYQQKPAAPKGSPQNPFVGMPGLFGENDMPAIGEARQTSWHGHRALQVEVDATRKVSKQTRLVYFFDIETKLPIGFRFNPGGYDAEGTYTDLKLDPPLKPRDFEFVPGILWNQIK